MLHYTTEQGLPTNSTYKLLQDRNGSFWISGPNLICSLQESEFLTSNAGTTLNHLLVQHSGTSRITLRAELVGEVVAVEIEDYGSGLRPPKQSHQPAGHYGMIGMEERVKRVGGTLKVESKNLGGTCVRILLKRPSVFRANAGWK